LLFITIFLTLCFALGIAALFELFLFFNKKASAQSPAVYGNAQINSIKKEEVFYVKFSCVIFPLICGRM